MDKSKWKDMTNLTLGVWFFFGPWVLNSNLIGDAATRTTLNSWIVGSAVAFFAGLALRELKPANEWVNLALGTWIVLSPWMFGYVSEPMLLWNSLIVGAAIGVLSGFSIPMAQRLTGKH